MSVANIELFFKKIQTASRNYIELALNRLILSIFFCHAKKRDYICMNLKSEH